MTETKIEPHNQANAKYLVDILFDANLFKEGVTRDDMQAVEDSLAFEFQAVADSAKRIHKFLAKVKK